MARIAETELQHLKAAASLAVVVQVQGRQAMLARVSAFYYQTLQNAPEAITYLENTASTILLPADGLLFHTLTGTETLSRPFVLTAELSTAMPCWADRSPLHCRPRRLMVLRSKCLITVKIKP